MDWSFIVGFLVGFAVATVFFIGFFFVWLRKRWTWLIAGAAKGIWDRLSRRASHHASERIRERLFRR